MRRIDHASSDLEFTTPSTVHRQASVTARSTSRVYPRNGEGALEELTLRYLADVNQSLNDLYHKMLISWNELLDHYLLLIRLNFSILAFERMVFRSRNISRP